MIHTGTANTSVSDSELAQLIGELTNRLQAGESIDLDSYVLANPAYADQLRELFPAMCLLTDLSQIVPQAPGGFAASSTMPVTEAGTLGDFRIAREVGRGGMGVVYEAEQISLKRRVALKVLPFAAVLDPRHLQRFKNEAQAAASLRHPHIVQVYSVGCERGVHYYAMDFIEGRTLASLIAELRATSGLPDEVDQPTTHASDGQDRERSGAAQEADTAKDVRPAASTDASVRSREFFHRVAGWGIQAAEALEHAHQMGVVHRDIKPSNLLIDLLGQLWITDFGLAFTRGGTGVTATGDVVGTLRYMSPEQASGHSRAVDHHTDIYSLAVTLYEVLTLHPLFPDGDRQAVWRQIISVDPAPPRRSNPAIPRDLETILIKALAKEPESRYASAQQFADDLRRFLADEPIRARRPSWGECVVKWSRRHAAFVTAAAVLLAIGSVVLAASGVYVWQAERRATVALDSAEAARDDTTAVLDFLTDELLASADPDVSEGRKITVEEVLTNAEAGLDTAFPEKPGVEATVRGTMGVIYSSLGRYDDAERHLLRARALLATSPDGDHHAVFATDAALASVWRLQGRIAESVELSEQTLATCRSQLGEEHLDTVMSMNGLGAAYQVAGRHPEAITLHEEALRLDRMKLGHEHSETLTSMNNLAAAYEAVGRRDEAISLYEETLRLHKKHPSRAYNKTLSVMGNLASAYLDAGRLNEALPMIEEELRLATELLGPTDQRTFHARVSLSGAYLSLGRWDDAVSLLEQTLPLAKEQLGSTHPDTLVVTGNLATAYLYAARLSEGIALNEETRELMESKLGSEHPSTLKARCNLANAYVEAGRWADALPLGEETLRLAKNALGSEHPRTLDAQVSVAIAYVRAGRYDEALPLFEQTLPRMRKISGPEHPDTLKQMYYLAMSYSATGQHEKSLALYEETLQLMRDKLGPAHPHTFTCMTSLGAAYVNAGRSQDGVRLTEETLSLMRKSLGLRHTATFTALQNLAMIYEKSARWDKVLPLREEALQVVRGQETPRPSEKLQALFDLAVTYTAMGRIGDALPLLEELLPLRKTLLGPKHPETYQTTYNLATILNQVGRRDEAITLLTEALSLQDDELEPKYPDRWRFLIGLATCYKDAGRWDDALPLAEEALQLARGQLSKGHPSILTLMENLSHAYIATDRWSDAQPILRERLELVRAKSPTDPLELAAALAVLGRCLMKQEQWSVAEALLRECLAIREQQIPEDWSTFNTQSSLGASLLGQGQYEAAEPLLTRGHEGLAARADQVPALAKPYIRDALERVVELYEAWGRPEQAAAWRQKLEAHH